MGKKRYPRRAPPGSAGVSPAYDPAQGNVRGRQPIYRKKLASETHPGARASRPHSTWHKEMSVDVSPFTAKSLRADPPGARGVSPAFGPAQGNVRGRQPIYRKKLASETPPGSAGVSPAYDPAQGNVRGRQPIYSKKLASGTHPGARASRPHSTWKSGNEPCKGGIGTPCKEPATDHRLFSGIRLRAGRPRSRVGCGRDARAPGWRRTSNH